MLSFKQLMIERKNKVVFQFGRFNPMTKGHQENINFGKDYAKKNNADYILFASQSQDSKKNPLGFEDKVNYLEKLMKVKVSKDTKLKTAFQILEHLGKTYSDVTFIVGEDRVQEFTDRMSKYTKDWGIDTFNVIESGKRTKGVSGTDMRSYVQNDDFESFMKNLPLNTSKEDAKDIFDLVKKGLKVD